MTQTTETRPARSAKNISAVQAATALLSGYSMMWRPGLRSLVIIPLLLNTLLLALLISTLGGWISGWVDVLVGWMPDWLSWLGGILRVAIWLAGALVFALIFTASANIVGAPFYGFLAARAEQQLTGAYPESRLGIAQEATLAMATEMRKLWYWLWRAAVLGVVSLILMFIPGVNVLVPALWFVFGAWMLSLEYLDYPASNHGLRFNQKRDWLRQRRVLSLGFGSGVALATTIPILNLFTPPAAVLAATRLWVDLLDKSAAD